MALARPAIGIIVQFVACGIMHIRRQNQLFCAFCDNCFRVNQFPGCEPRSHFVHLVSAMSRMGLPFRSGAAPAVRPRG
jgi:hypothetical protein